MKLKTSDIAIAQYDEQGPIGPGIIHIPSQDWNHVIKRNEKDKEYATEIYLDVSEIDIQNDLNPKISIDRISFYCKTDKYVRLDVDIDTFGGSGYFLSFPQNFIIPSDVDGVVCVFNYYRETMFLSINYISNRTNSPIPVYLYDENNYFVKMPGNSYFLYTRLLEGNSVPDPAELSSNDILTVFKHYTGNNILETMMINTRITIIDTPVSEFERQIVNVVSPIMFRLNQFDFSNMNPPEYPIVDSERINNYVEIENCNEE